MNPLTMLEEFMMHMKSPYLNEGDYNSWVRFCLSKRHRNLIRNKRKGK